MYRLCYYNYTKLITHLKFKFLDFTFYLIIYYFEIMFLKKRQTGYNFNFLLSNVLLYLKYIVSKFK